MHMSIRMPMHTCLYSFICIVYAHVCTHVYAHADGYLWGCTLVHVRTHVYRRVRPCLNTRARTCLLHTCLHTRLHTWLHTCLHTGGTKGRVSSNFPRVNSAQYRCLRSLVCPCTNACACTHVTTHVSVCTRTKVGARTHAPPHPRTGAPTHPCA